MPIRDLLLTNRAQVFFHGHDHLFCKQDYYASGVANGLPDLIYQEVPQPSHYPYNATNYATGTNLGYNYQSGIFFGNSGHLRVTVSPANARVEYVRSYRPSDEAPGVTNRMVSYSYRIPAPGNPPPVFTGPSITNGRFQFTINGATGQNYTVQTSLTLSSWTNVFTTNSPAMPLVWSDTNMPGFGRRFYRVWVGP